MAMLINILSEQRDLRLRRRRKEKQKRFALVGVATLGGGALLGRSIDMICITLCSSSWMYHLTSSYWRFGCSIYCGRSGSYCRK